MKSFKEMRKDREREENERIQTTRKRIDNATNRELLECILIRTGAYRFLGDPK